MIFKRIDHVEIVTDQLDRTEKFYTEVLGFAVKIRDRIERSGLGVPIDLVYLDLGGTVVELKSRRLLGDVDVDRGSGEQGRYLSLIHISEPTRRS